MRIDNLKEIIVSIEGLSFFMPKIIDEKIKRIALEKYWNGESYNKIASDLYSKYGE